MAVTLRKIDSILARASADALNRLRVDMLQVKAGAVFHVDTSPADASPTAADLPTVIVMANALKAELNTSFASALQKTITSSTYGQGVHMVADATNTIAAAAASDLATSITLLNAIKTAFNAHLTQAGVHITNDGTNTVATTNASDLPTSITLANALQGKVNAHFAAALAHQAVVLVAP